MAYDPESGTYIPDDLSWIDPYNDVAYYGNQNFDFNFDPYYDYGISGIPYYMQPATDFTNMDWSNPNSWLQYGLLPSDFVDSGGGQIDWSQYGVNPNDPYGINAQNELPSTLTNDQFVTLYNNGVNDFSGMDLTDEQIQALRDMGEAEPTGNGGDTSQTFWDKAKGALGSAVQGLGGIGGSVLDAAMKNPLAALTLLGGGAAAIGALSSPDPKQIPTPSFTGPAQLGPEQRDLYNMIAAQAARENTLGNAALPGQLGILGNIAQMQPGLGAQAVNEQTARNTALQNIQTGLTQNQNPNALPTEYQPWMANATTAEGLVGNLLSQGLQPSLEAQQRAQEMRAAYDEQQLRALGPGYVTSFPYQEGKAALEKQIDQMLQNDAITMRQNQLNMYSGVSLPRAQFAETAKTGQVSRNTQQMQSNLQQYQGLNTTADTLGKLAATAGAAAPTGTANQGLSGLTANADRQQQLLNSIYQFNANLQNQKNQNLWQFAGTALGGGLYGMNKKTS